ncbi:SusC/RagA family TonB-linked outer membrane protein [Formosa haliotis]|uniref:SusC/RagA family TonB-linked outer membrane protein n=1 Tax=Formosa haliotis TaxID=1555194 RepID=UPI000826A0B5|nr:SusC/RagA family TonB-linked outer membrane protein [Formosa haliotis]
MYQTNKIKKCSIKPKLVLALLVGLSFSSTYAITETYTKDETLKVSEQNLTVTGTVISKDDGMPAAGVTILLKGAQGVGTVTDFDGNYSIEVPSSSSVLVFSSIGFGTQEINVAGRSTVNVSLETNMSELDEVVVVGFGTQKKATLTGSVVQVKGDDMIKGKGTSSAALALQGEVPGLVVTRTSSRPGNEGTDLKIRGDISVNNISPLILLDGLEIPEWQLATLNPNDIETYSVLKDGAAAIFGTKAAGGVILVTTKKGKKGTAPKVSYKGETQLNFVREYPLSNMQEWSQLWLTAGDNDGIDFIDSDGNQQTAASNYRFFTRDELVSIIDGSFPMAPESYFWLGKDHYFSDQPTMFDEMYGTTFSERHDLSISGGSEKATYRTSVGYANERSPISFVYDGQKRYNFRTNVTYDVSDMISTDFIVSYDNRTTDVPTQGVGFGVQDASWFPLYNPAGQYYDNFGGNNGLAYLDEGGRTKNNDEIFRLGGKINFDFDKYVKGLSFYYQGNFSSKNNHKTTRKTSVTMYDWEGNVTSTPTTLLNSSVNEESQKQIFQSHIFQLNYNRTFGNHTIGGLIGYTAEQTQTNNYDLFRSNMASDELDDINTGDVTTQTNAGGSNAVGLISYIGKLNYNFKGIYLLEVLGRRDGSSRLDPDYRWKNFYGGSAGIVFSEMSFMEGGFFDLLKVRASYGETGSVVGIGAYDYYSSIGYGSTIFGTSPELYNTAYINGITSTDRTWERVGTTNFALDFAIFNNRLNATAEYFIRKNDDMLINITYPQVLGATAPKTNSGTFETTGYELSVNWRDQIGDFSYNVGLSFWDNTSEVTRMEGAQNIAKGVNGVLEGKPLNAIYAYKTDGIMSTEEEVLNYYNEVGFIDPSNQNGMKAGTLLPNYRSADRLVPGTVKRVDVSGDGIINEDDLVYVGDTNPHKSFGINLGFAYKGFDFSTFFQGVADVNIVRTGSLAYPFAQWWTNQNASFLGNTWTVDNQNADLPASYYNGARKSWNFDLNDMNVIKAAYMRAKVISVGYSLPQQTLERIGVDRIRVSLTGNDLFVISNVKDGLDPEAGIDTRQGSQTPFVSTMILGLELTF